MINQILLGFETTLSIKRISDQNRWGIVFAKDLLLLSLFGLWYVDWT